MHGNVRDDSEQHRITLTSVQKWTQDFFERFPKSEWSYNIGVYGNVLLLLVLVPDHWVLRCGSLQIKKWNKITEFVYTWVWPGAGVKDSEGVQSIGSRKGLGPRIRRESRVLYWPQNGAREEAVGLSHTTILSTCECDCLWLDSGLDSVWSEYVIVSMWVCDLSLFLNKWQKWSQGIHNVGHLWV